MLRARLIPAPEGGKVLTRKRPGKRVFQPTSDTADMSLTLPRGRVGAASSDSEPISRETAWLLGICLFDTVSSALLFHYGMASEANPVLRPFAEAGTLPFVLAKSATFLPALAAGEWYRRRRPEFVLPLLRGAAILYTAIYAGCVARQFWG